MPGKYKIVLGSKSIRRQELLRKLDIDFEIKTIDTEDETFSADLPIEDIPIYLASKKATSLKSIIDKETVLITADTIVVLDGKIYGKPNSKSEAVEIIQSLSGRTHDVFTGVAITTFEQQETFFSKTEVTFSKFTQEEISYYVNKYKPMDKAGAYGIQEWIGFIGVEKINGSFYNVMGLPVQLIYQRLKKYM